MFSTSCAACACSLRLITVQRYKEFVLHTNLWR
nr:MAG TPA: antimicrobial protein [Caudoviricetes sp.]